MEIKNKTLEQVFENRFSRSGEVLVNSDIKPNLFSYEIMSVDNELSKADLIVRDVESDFAPIYDDVQFTTPGMKDMAERDTVLLEKWIGNPNNKRILEIGPGTGRITLPLAEVIGPNGKIYGIETAKPYLDKLIQKASKAGIDPSRVGLCVADIQTINSGSLNKFLDYQKVDLVALWFGPLALMTTNPQEVFNKAASVLKTGGEVILTTNSLDGLSYRIPEKDSLGYKPSIFTRRYFAEKGSNTPSGMILGTDQVLPAIFYDVDMLRPMMEKAGLQITDVQGTTRLTGIFPADSNDKEAISKYINIVSVVEPDTAKLMKGVENDPQAVWRIAQSTDKAYCQDKTKLSQYTYLGVRAKKI